ncbi:2OG-Fe(II) oxygenase [Sphingopyxis sp. XHP0097]|uniref:2OG-Fe(II) oxygenase n=1 Tax=Sphingopyxis jiangsuensis TaxID=2871171 RepID=A0ABS7MCW2_9SPHN|nr:MULTISPECIES: 2OG-Fe(II) oxygenase [Sphingopyxis]MBY4636819.1 2OG-Fe(II) oxygenase [Sphingopyxis jiangsuensis]
MFPASVFADAQALDIKALAHDLNEQGWHVVPQLLSPEQCAALRHNYRCDDRYRSTVVMQRHGFGRGEYRYFRYPLPDPIAQLRTRYYVPLAGLANEWMQRTGKEQAYPADHATFIEQCHARGQQRPTPLILRYRTGDFNCLHQDLYGEVHFPFQMAILLSEPGCDFHGGDFVITEQRPRMQSRAHVVPLGIGDAVIFPVNEAPRDGTRGTYRVKLRHGVSVVRSGERFTLGIIFHDAS